MTTQTIVAKKELFDTIKWRENVGAGEDCLFPLEVAYHGFKIGHLQSYHVTYWAHDDNLSNCNGQHSPSRMIPVYDGFVAFHKTVLEQFELTPSQRNEVKSRLAKCYVWQLGYNCYSALGQFSNVC